MRNKRLFILALAALLALLSGCGGRYYGIQERAQPQEGQGYTQAILPDSEGIAANQVPATVYYRYSDEMLLAPVSYLFAVTAESSLEEQLVQKLIDGPQDANYELIRLINPDTRIVEIKEQHGFLAVTLSSEFLTTGEGTRGGEEARQAALALRRLAVSSIVNTITELGKYSRVLVLIDTDGSGAGERLTYGELGLDQADASERTVPPMERDTEVLLTPRKVTALVLQSLIEKDYARMDTFLATKDYDGGEKPLLDTMTEQLAAKLTVVGFTVREDVTIAQDGQQATAVIDLNYVDATGHPAKVENLPVRLVREEVWKVSFPSLLNNLPE